MKSVAALGEISAKSCTISAAASGSGGSAAAKKESVSENIAGEAGGSAAINDQRQWRLISNEAAYQLNQYPVKICINDEI